MGLYTQLEGKEGDDKAIRASQAARGREEMHRMNPIFVVLI